MTSKELPEPEAGMTRNETGATRLLRRDYSPPMILSAEPLEAAAATCDPPAGSFGKVVPGICTVQGS